MGEAEHRRKLGSDLYERRYELVRAVIISRGGTAANVKEAGPYADLTLLETASMAVAGNQEAQKAVKIVKQARRLGQKF